MDVIRPETIRRKRSYRVFFLSTMDRNFTNVGPAYNDIHKSRALASLSVIAPAGGSGGKFAPEPHVAWQNAFDESLVEIILF
jgi:hypothetical protein